MKWNHIKISATLFLLTNALFFLCGFNTLTKISFHSTILSMIIGSILAFLILSLLFNLLQNKTLDLTKLSTPLACIVIIILFGLLNFTIPKITGFISYNVVQSISFYLIIPLFLLISIFAVSKGLGTIVRSAFIYLCVILFLTVITFLTLFSKIDVENVLPIIDTSFANIIKSSLLYMIIALAPYFYLSFFTVRLNKEKIKSLKKGFLCTHGFILFYTLMIISILGIPLVNLYHYPEVSIFKKISFLNIVDRMETIFSLSYFLSIFIYFTITMYGIFELLQKKFFIKKRGILLFILAFLLLIANQLYTINIIIWFNSLAVLFLLVPLTSKS